MKVVVKVVGVTIGGGTLVVQDPTHPDSIIILRMLSCPLYAAFIIAVEPVLSTAFTFAPALIRIRTTEPWPLSDALRSAVQPAFDS